MSEYKLIHVTATVEALLTPFNIRSKYKTIHEWLSGICQGKMPNSPISEFNMGLGYRDRKEHIVSLYGVNTRLDEKGRHYTYIDFKPSSVFFIFPKVKYRNFTPEQMQEELNSQLREFFSTELFLDSFLSKANIRPNYEAEPIWIKK